MDTTSLDSGLATVLRNYYRATFLNEENWAKIESIRFDGTLQFPQGVARFTAYKKKPDRCKVVLEARGGQIVMAYDGQEAWQQSTFQSSQPTSAPELPAQGSGVRPERHPVAQSLELGTPGSPDSRLAHTSPANPPIIPHSSAIRYHSTPMPPAEAANFIRDATTGGHLLYPGIEGKTIQLLGTTTVDGHRLYDLQITLPDGQQILSQLDMTTFAEVRQITTNNVTGDEEVVTHTDFKRIDGVRVPHTSTLTIDGQQIHQSRLHRVQTNKGVMPWMFSRPNSPGSDSSGSGVRPERQSTASATPRS